MELGKRVRVTKGDHQNCFGIITRMVWTGHGRKWRIWLDDDREIDVHAKSLAVEANSTRLPLQETEESYETESVETGNDYNGVENGSEIDMEAFCD
jgi:hypothetical protein